MKNLQGLDISPTLTDELLHVLGKTDAECRAFFGDALWDAPGFAFHWLEQTTTIIAWIRQREHQLPSQLRFGDD